LNSFFNISALKRNNIGTYCGSSFCSFQAQPFQHCFVWYPYIETSMVYSFDKTLVESEVLAQLIIFAFIVCKIKIGWFSYSVTMFYAVFKFFN
jgi:hypothetical protein